MGKNGAFRSMRTESSGKEPEELTWVLEHYLLPRDAILEATEPTPSPPTRSTAVMAVPLTVPSRQRELRPLHGPFFDGRGRNGTGGNPTYIFNFASQKTNGRVVQ
jgi:hypothetical protein